MKRFPKGGIRKNAQEFVDADYLDQLSPEERDWYDNYIKAEYGASRASARKLGITDFKKLDRTNYRRRTDAYNKLDRSKTADKLSKDEED